MIGAVILNYNTAEHTIACVESIRKWNSEPLRIVVVDNASTNDSVERLRSYLETNNGAFELVVSEKNGGYAQGNNIGLKLLDADDAVTELLVLNNDVLFTQDMLPALKSFLDSHPDAGVVSPLLYCRDGRTVDNTCARKDCTIREIVWTYLLYFTNIMGILSGFSSRRKILLANPDLLNAPEVEIELPSGSCFMIRKDLFSEIGFFDPNTFLYYEENILYRKLLKAGKQSYLLPSVACIHLGGETTNKVSHSASYMKSSKASGYYYAMHYRNPGLFERMALTLSYKWYNCMVGIVKTVKKWKGN